MCFGALFLFQIICYHVTFCVGIINLKYILYCFFIDVISNNPDLADGINKPDLVDDVELTRLQSYIYSVTFYAYVKTTYVYM